MCGACGSRSQQDEWSGVLDSRRARWEAATLLNEILSRSGHPVRVAATTGPWVVRSGTGRDVVAETATAVWRTLEPLRLAATDLDPVLRRDSASPVAAALRAAFGAPRTTDAPG